MVGAMAKPLSKNTNGATYFQCVAVALARQASDRSVVLVVFVGARFEVPRIIFAGVDTAEVVGGQGVDNLVVGPESPGCSAGALVSLFQ